MLSLLAHDSTGKELESKIHSLHNGYFHMFLKPGATIQSLTDDILQSIDYIKYNYVIVQVGVNEFTTKIGPSVVCNYNNTSEGIENLKSKFVMMQGKI